MMNQYDTLVEATQALHKQGYTASFKYQNGQMFCTDNNQYYSANQMKITEYHRFEGETNPADMSVVFAVVCEDSTKGIIISPYGTYADKKMIQFLDDIKILSNDDKISAGNR